MYGVVPFVSRRSTGIVCGLVSAGGAVGGVINQAIFFLNTPAHGAYGAHARCFATMPLRVYALQHKPSAGALQVLGVAPHQLHYSNSCGGFFLGSAGPLSALPR